MDVLDDDFERLVIEQSKKIPVLVDFWAPWCGPCIILKPVLEKISLDFKDKFVLAKINVDENEKISNKYSIMSIPCVKLFKNGIVVDEFVGAQPEEIIINWLRKRI